MTLGDTSLSAAVCRNEIPTNTTPDTNLHCFNKSRLHHFSGRLSCADGLCPPRFGESDCRTSQSLIQSVQANTTPPTPANAANYDAIEGELLHLALLKYLNYVTAAGQTIGQLNGVSGESGVHLGLTSLA